MGSLDQHCLSPSFTWSVHMIWKPGNNLQDTTPRPRITLMAQPVLGIFYWLPCESWIWVVPPHSTAWLYWFPYHVFDAVPVKYQKVMYSGYYRNLGFLRYGNEYCVLEGDTGVNSQTSPVPLPQKLISSRPNPTKKLGENPVPFHSRKNDSPSLPLPCRFFTPILLWPWDCFVNVITYPGLKMLCWGNDIHFSCPRLIMLRERHIFLVATSLMCKQTCVTIATLEFRDSFIILFWIKKLLY